MGVEKESGDYIGYDVRVLRIGSGYRLALSCSEGGLTGPVKVEFQVDHATALIRPKDHACGTEIKLTFTPKGMVVATEFIYDEYIPRRRNYLKEDHWR